MGCLPQNLRCFEAVGSARGLSWSCDFAYKQLRAVQEVLPEARRSAEVRTRLQFSNAAVIGRAVCCAA